MSDFHTRPLLLTNILAVCVLMLSCSNDSDHEDSLSCDASLIKCGDTCCASDHCCNDVCIAVESDAQNCGQCSHVCDSGLKCIEGECREDSPCPANQAWCEGSCFSIQSDAAHCGNCTTQCKPTETCRDGKCMDTCADGYTMVAGGICADTEHDSEHCGADDTKCPDNTYCNKGKCECQSSYHDCDEDMSNGCESETPCMVPGQCQPPLISCNDECINPFSDDKNCGKCDTACEDGTVCVYGTCKPTKQPEQACEQPKKLCYGKCIDILTDDNNCGKCLNQCPENTKCEAGKCKPDCKELTLCDGACVDTTTSINHCGDCGTACGKGQSCADSLCQCAKGHWDCDGNPGNGCESNAECACDPKDPKTSTRSCWSGSESNVIRDEKGQLTGAKGVCKLGKQTCDESGRFWGPCLGAVTPTALTCDDYGNLNNLDNDCDGKIDTECRSKCDLEAGEMSYIGCEYWSVYLDNLITTNHTLVFSNPSYTDDADVYIFDKAKWDAASQTPLHTIKLKPQQVSNITLNTKTTNMCSATSSMLNAYRIRSTHPVTAYQFNPWDSASAHSNDASLLMPANVLGKDYIAMTWHSEEGDDHRSYITVIATEPGKTKVQIKTTANIIAGTDITAMKPGESREFTLDRFGVLTLMAPASESEDQTGTTIHADKKVAVFGGSRSTFVPSSKGANGCCRDHIEEQLLPTQAWGKSYYAVAAYNTKDNGDFWRILARDDNTSVTLKGFYQNEMPDKTITLNAGQAYEAFNAHSFEVQADKPIVLGQFLPSKGFTGNEIGDPSFILTVPYEQYRDDYAFMVPDTYDTNYLTVIAPVGTKAELDGQQVTTWLKQGTVGNQFMFGYIPITPGIHRMKADHPFGLYGYGYFNMASYGYPIGLNIKSLETN
ncbi:MAG: hypothetical protein IJM59_00045 [Proteobacteria bacterium]|nr:hypothetical protein [Pseudomonadota bacterium]